MTENLELSEFKRVVKDLIARRSMNSLGELEDHNMKEAVFEAGGSHALRMLVEGLEYYEERGEWPAEIDERYVEYTELLEETNTQVDEERRRGVE